MTQNREEGDFELSFSFLQENYFEKVNLEKRNKMLDIGFGNGKLLECITENYEIECFGIEINNEKFKKAKSNYPELHNRLFLGNPSEHFKNDTFDLITMFDVIEHIPDPIHFLKTQVYPLLRNNGVFIFQTPNKYTNSIKETIEWKSFSKWKKEHCSLQTPKSLSLLLSNSNFDNIKLSKYRFNSNFKIEKLRSLIPLIPAEKTAEIISNLPINVHPNIWGIAYKNEKKMIGI
jgi:2-polyprenyl-3-methyl-5-hydroxy-6-metoxy-1,4-benzoquinol methylase